MLELLTHYDELFQTKPCHISPIFYFPFQKCITPQHTHWNLQFYGQRLLAT